MSVVRCLSFVVCCIVCVGYVSYVVVGLSFYRYFVVERLCLLFAVCSVLSVV